MARKTLLTEAELRSFMKLAELRPIGDDRIKEMYGDEDTVDEGEDREDDDGAGEAGVTSEEMEVDMEMGGDDDPPDMAAAPDMGAAPDAGGGKMVSIDDFMGALESALEDVLDDEVEVDMDDDDDDMPGMDDDDDDDGMPGMDDDDDDMMGDDDPPGMGGGYKRGPMMEEEDIVNEVARRVAARLQDKQNKAEMVDQLAERILNRLTSK
tara:strand:+ start:2670 stop:3296 length:627 start_codon:yes stop_codon:yes gene_type:complete